MALYLYFRTHSNSILPDPRGPLSREIPSTASHQQPSLVKSVVQQDDNPAQPAAIRKQAAERGEATTVLWLLVMTL